MTHHTGSLLFTSASRSLDRLVCLSATLLSTPSCATPANLSPLLLFASPSIAMSSTPRPSASSSGLWDSPDMPILTEDVLNQHGHLTVEQFLQQQCEAQVTSTHHISTHRTVTTATARLSADSRSQLASVSHALHDRESDCFGTQPRRLVGCRLARQGSGSSRAAHACGKHQADQTMSALHCTTTHVAYRALLKDGCVTERSYVLTDRHSTLHCSATDADTAHQHNSKPLHQPRHAIRLSLDSLSAQR